MKKETERDADLRAPADLLVRKPYASPALRVYGDVAALTRAVGFSSTNADGGAVIGMRKTH